MLNKIHLFLALHTLISIFTSILWIFIIFFGDWNGHCKVSQGQQVLFFIDQRLVNAVTPVTG